MEVEQEWTQNLVLFRQISQYRVLWSRSTYACYCVKWKKPSGIKLYSIWSRVVQYSGARYWRHSTAWGCWLRTMLHAEIMQKSMKILNKKNPRKSLYDIGTCFCVVWWITGLYVWAIERSHATAVECNLSKNIWKSSSVLGKFWHSPDHRTVEITVLRSVG